MLTRSSFRYTDQLFTVPGGHVITSVPIPAIVGTIFQDNSISNFDSGYVFVVVYFYSNILFVFL